MTTTTNGICRGFPASAVVAKKGAKKINFRFSEKKFDEIISLSTGKKGEKHYLSKYQLNLMNIRKKLCQITIKRLVSI